MLILFSILKAIIAPAIVFLLSLYYIKNEKFYLFIQRILFKFRKFDKSFIKIDIKLITNKPLDETILSIKKSKIDHGKVDITGKKISLDEEHNGRIFSISATEEEHLKRTDVLISGRFPIYKPDYDLDFENFRSIHNVIRHSIGSNESKINFVISMKNNPYESFFIKQIPGHKLKDYNISLDLDNVHITAQKDKIISRADNIDKLISKTKDILTLKLPIIKAT